MTINQWIRQSVYDLNDIDYLIRRLINDMPQTNRADVALLYMHIRDIQKALQAAIDEATTIKL